VQIGTLAIEFEPGDSYETPPGSGQRTAEEAAKERADARIHAIGQFREAADFLEDPADV
jgi:hypothetical protein